MSVVKDEDISALIASAASVIPDNIEYALYAYAASKSVDIEAIRSIVALYQSGDFVAAQNEVDLLDGRLDGRLHDMRLEGADVPRLRRRTQSDPD